MFISFFSFFLFVLSCRVSGRFFFAFFSLFLFLFLLYLIRRGAFCTLYWFYVRVMQYDFVLGIFLGMYIRLSVFADCLLANRQ